MSMGQTTTISVRDISVDVWQKVKAAAALKHQKVSDYLNDLLSRAMNGKGK